ncbi:MAG: SGNH/GDSL hydrolase family protein [Bacteroidota bacterium]
MNFNFKLILFLLFTAFVSCKPNLDEPRYTGGQAVFTRFVAIGDDFGSGFSDGALTRINQTAAVPLLLAEKFQLAEGGEFNQALMPAGNGAGYDYISNAFSGVFSLSSYINCQNKLSYQILKNTFYPATQNWLGAKHYNNYCIPGLKSFQAYSQFAGKSYPAGNLFYHRMASDTGIAGLSSTVLGDVQYVNPTFVMVWIGASDVYNYAFSGGAGEVGGLNTYDITPVDTFANAINYIFNGLTGAGQKGIVVNIPDLADIPYFNAVSYDDLKLSAQQANDLNMISPPGFHFSAGNNALVIAEPTGGVIRQIRKGEYVLNCITSDSINCGGWGTPQKPIPANYILDSNEVSKISNRIAIFNSDLRTAANAKGFAFFDFNRFMSNLKSGYSFSGTSATSAMFYGGAVSLDGYHLTPRGYAMVANECIKSINSKYKSNLPLVNTVDYSGGLFP